MRSHHEAVIIADDLKERIRFEAGIHLDGNDFRIAERLHALF